MKIIACGGDDLGWWAFLPDDTDEEYPTKITIIDRKIIEMSGKENPNVLFVGTASGDMQKYTTCIKEHFGQRMGCNVSELKLANETPTESKIRKVLDNTDIIVVGGGDTKFMLNRWKEIGFDKLLKEYADKGIVLSGASAGACCWFDWYDNSDDIENDLSQLDLLPGLGFIKGFADVHYDGLVKDFGMPENYKEVLLDLLNSKDVNGYGIDNYAAIIFDNGNISFLSDTPDAKVHIIR